MILVFHTISTAAREPDLSTGETKSPSWKPKMAPADDGYPAHRPPTSGWQRRNEKSLRVRWGNEHQSAGPKCGDQNALFDGARGLRVGEVQERNELSEPRRPRRPRRRSTACRSTCWFCAVRVASHPVSMKAPRISIQVEAEHDRATCTASRIRTVPSSTRMKPEKSGD